MSIDDRYDVTMASGSVLRPWVVDALQELGGGGSVVEVARLIWRDHEEDLRGMGNLFYTWQYDMRWAAQKLRDDGTLVKLHGQRSGRWTLADHAARS